VHQHKCLASIQADVITNCRKLGGVAAHTIRAVPEPAFRIYFVVHCTEQLAFTSFQQLDGLERASTGEVLAERTALQRFRVIVQVPSILSEVAMLVAEIFYLNGAQ
jgi:hypothetical protein